MGQGHGGKARPWVAGKACAKAAHQILIARPDLRAFAQNLAGFGVYQVQPATCRDILQSTRPQRGLHLPLTAGCIKRLCDEKP